MIDKLKELNFNVLFTLDTDVNEYTFEKYRNNGNRHPQIKKVCTLCEEKSINICPSDKNFKLLAMGHGAMTDDILTATGLENTDRSKWKEQGVMFVLENPGPCKQIYSKVICKGFTKYPTHEWYWVNHNNPHKCEYPDSFKGKVYGELFCSVMFTFKLNNLYITDLIKCGMNDNKNNFKNIMDAGKYQYHEKCIENCLEAYFYKELQFINPSVIFCLGRGTENILKDKQLKMEKSLGHKIEIVYLWHPQSRHSGKEFQKHYYTEIVTGLFNAKIITKEERKHYLEKVNLIPGPDITKIEIEDNLLRIKNYLEKNGYILTNPHNNYIVGRKISTVDMAIQIKNGIYLFNWGNGGNERYSENWFKNKNIEVCKTYPGSYVEIGAKNKKWVRLYIPVEQDNFLESILDIIKNTKKIML